MVKKYFDYKTAWGFEKEGIAVAELANILQNRRL
jgi:hypothetical protein